MVSYLLNKEQYILGFIEWEVVNEFGKLKDGGDYVFIQEMWLHKGYRNRKDIFKMLINLVKVHKLTQNATKVYWVRRKYNERQSVYLKSKF